MQLAVMVECTACRRQVDEAAAKLDIRKAEAVKQAAARVRKQIAAVLQEQRKQQKQTDAKGTSQSQVGPHRALC